MRSSRAAVDLIVAHEVSSKAVYEKKYQRPEWPGVQSGITVGIGYDLGYNTPDDIYRDWKDFLPPNVVQAMQRYAGLKGSAAKNALPAARQSIVVPWEPAMAVFMRTSLPKFENAVLKKVPVSDKLPPGCFGVLASLAYNRGPSFTTEGDRYKEMRDIRTYVSSGQWDRVPNAIRRMKRLWPTVAGLIRRREEEADLWEKSLAASQNKQEADLPENNRVDTGDDKSLPDVVTPSGNQAQPELNVQPPRGVYSMEVELIQRQLIEFKYFEVGDPDGLIGGKFVAGVAAFMTDRGKDPNKGRITPELKAELAQAKLDKLPDGRPWSRPIAPSRAEATAKDIAPKVESVNQTWYTKLYAWFLGIPSAAVALFKSMFGDYDTPGSYITEIKNFFSSIPTEYYFVAIAGIAALILYQATKAQNATVKDYQQGKIN